MAGSRILIRGGAGLRTVIHANSNGEFVQTLPYGHYRLSSTATPDADIGIFVGPYQTNFLDIVIDATGSVHDVQSTARTPGVWTDATGGRLYPEGFTLQALLSSREPSMVTEPLDFTGLRDNRLAVASHRGFSWTDTQYGFQGMDATDSYQPGRPAGLPDVQALDAVSVDSAPLRSSVEVGAFLAEPGASWHGSLLTANTGARFSSTNLPSPPARGLVQQVDRFHWFTRDRLEIGGPLARWADVYASASGQWASQTEPLAVPGTDQNSRFLSATARARVTADPEDRFDALYSGSRIDLSDGGIPAGLEAMNANRLAPSFVLPGGFPGEPETGHFDFIQAGWIHLWSPASRLGVIEVRYGYSTAHLDTRTAPTGQSRIELLGGTVVGAPPLANLAVRPRQGIEAAWQPAILRVLGTRHRIAAGAAWKKSTPHNRFTAPSDMNLIVANGIPAFAVEFNTPLDSRGLVRSQSIYFADHLNVTTSLVLDLGAFADFSRGSLPAQSSPAGSFTPERMLAARPDLIVWNNLSPRAGFGWQLPHSHGLILRGAYFRSFGPLAGHYLDFGNPNSLGGSVYQWLAGGSDSSVFHPVEQGSLILRFGGPYSSISPTLRRPYSDQFDVAAEFPFASRSIASIHLFRRDTRNRIAAINIGVSAEAFTPVAILDPGPDGIAGTFDDQQLTVYTQNPATFGQDRYLLTNPAGLRMLNTGFVAEAGTEWRRFMLHASFAAEKSYGPANPGDAVYENDPGVIGSLFLDPNTGILAAGRSFVDRAYVGKVQATYQLPKAWGGLEIAGVADYTDGLVFARRLLVSGLPQGPFLVAATVRGSPEGGNRAQYMINWNLRFSRLFRLPFGRLTALADVLNVTNAGQRIQENDLSGPSFNQRLPVAIQPPRFIRIGFRYDF